MRPTFPDLVQSLGYCCVWCFFRCFGRSSKIADRLGLSSRTVRDWRARFKAGEFKCTRCEKCLRDRLVL